MVSAREKISSSHLERLAIVYLRQSSPKQVRENFRSTERQYALADEAERLGWESERVVVLDGDLGISGRFSDSRAREGYKQLVARVCLGEVGAIFGLEIARLARSNAELQRLLEFCGLTDTLVVDADGIYDLQNFNDRLLLGLKSQMSEAELHIITSRLQGAKRAAAERGELRFPLPVGYVCDEEGQTIIDPDQEVQAAIADVFAAFAQDRLGLRRGRRVQGPAVPEARLRRGVGGRAAMGGADASAGARRAVEPVLRRARMCSGATAPAGRSRPDGTITTKVTELPRARVAGADPRPPSGLHHLGAIPGQRAAPGRERHPLRSAPAAGRPRDLPGDLALRRVRRVDHDASPPRGQLLRMRPLARRPHQHPRVPVGQDDRGRRADRPQAARSAGAGGDRTRARRRRRGLRPSRPLDPRRGTAGRARPLRGDPR